MFGPFFMGRPDWDGTGDPCCRPADLFNGPCGSFPGQAFYEWMHSHGYDGTQGNVMLNITGNPCAHVGNNGTFSLAAINFFAWQNHNVSASPGICHANPRLSVLLACNSALSSIQVSGHYGGWSFPGNSVELFWPVNPASLFGATIVLPGTTWGTWTITLPE